MELVFRSGKKDINVENAQLYVNNENLVYFAVLREDYAVRVRPALSSVASSTGY